MHRVTLWFRNVGPALDPFDADLGVAGIAEAELGGCRFGEINDPAPYKRAPVVDRDQDRLTRPLIHNAHLGAEGQGLVRRGHGAGVHPVPARRAVAW